MPRPSLAFALLLACCHANACGDLLDARFRPLAGKGEVDLCQTYAGKVLLIVNTASKCGFTRQYDALEKLHATYLARGFTVLGFPSNDFAGQEPGSEAEIREFCTLTYGVRFPMFEKVHVKGDAVNPFYAKLAEASAGRSPTWNFYKYLIDRNGNVVADFTSKVKPDDKELVARIEALVEAPVAP